MQAYITNFRGIKSASFTMNPIALVAGPNTAGKSSVAQAVTAILLGDPAPLDGLKKMQAPAMIHAGAEKGAIALGSMDSGNEWNASIAYPSAKLQTEGVPPAASRYACGLDSLAWMNTKDRADALLALLKALPTEADCMEALAKLDIDAELGVKLWERIQTEGWDGAHVHAKKTGATMKGQWLEVTGEQHGSAKAPSWLPENYEPDLAGSDEETLNGLVVQEKEFLESHIATTAISDAERARLDELAAGIDGAQHAFDTTTAGYQLAGGQCTAALEAFNELPEPVAEASTVPCPHCSEPVQIVSGELRKPEPFNAGEQDQIAQAKETARSKMVDTSENLRQISVALEVITKDLANCKAAEATLAEETDTGPTEDAGLETARNSIAHAERRLEAFQKKTRADSLTTGIAINASVVDMLAADGLRLTKMQDALTTFNATLFALCSIAEWPQVEIEQDLTITYGGRSYAMLGSRGSERFRLRVVLQIACASLDGSAAVIVDGADILAAREDRNGLMNLLIHWGNAALVTIALAGVDDMPELGAPVGASYWIEKGVIA